MSKFLVARLYSLNGDINTRDNYAVIEAKDIMHACSVYNQTYDVGLSRTGNCITELVDDVPNGRVTDWQAMELILHKSK